MSDGINEDDLKKVLDYLYKLSLKHHNDCAYANAMASDTGLDIDNVNHICNYAKIKGWVSAVDYTTAGTWSMQITQGGVSKLESMTKTETTYDDNQQKGRSINWVKWAAIFGGIAVVLLIVGLVPNFIQHPTTDHTSIANTTSGEVIQSNGQSGGITTGQVIINNATISQPSIPPRQFDYKVIALLNKFLPLNSTSKVHILYLVNDQESYQFASKINTALNDASWKTTFNAAMFEPPFSGMHIKPQSNGDLNIEVGSNG